MLKKLIGMTKHKIKQKNANLKRYLAGDNEELLNEYEYLMPCLDKNVITDKGNAYGEAIKYMQDNKMLNVLDLGHGAGQFKEYLLREIPDAKYTGVDVYIDTKLRDDSSYIQYDGVNLPFEHNSIEMIVSVQVLEHVRKPSELLSSVCAALTKSGRFIGSCSGLEPVHGKSVFNYTPFGLKFIFEESGLELEQIAAGVAADSLINYHAQGYLGLKPEFTYESKLYDDLTEKLLRENAPMSWINFAKLAFAGHIHFAARKAGKA